MTRFVFVTGGVASSLGKGVAAAALAVLLQARGHSVRLRKLDPYLNVDPGTMSPTQHGEVFVTEDGTETDLDLGHYERFTGVDATKDDTITSGRIYRDIIGAERRGEFLGATVQVVPHVTDAIKAAIVRGAADVDFVIVEIGGTVGDIEALPFLEAVRQIRNDLPRDTAINVHLTLLPWIPSAGELKTKPTQHSVRELRGIGIQPDVLLCRADRPIPVEERRKLALFCNVRPDAVVEALDVPSIYRVPSAYHQAGLDAAVLDAFGLENRAPDLGGWSEIAIPAGGPRVSVALVGKYTGLKDAYKSVAEALIHSGMRSGVEIDVRWIDSEDIEATSADEVLADVDAVLVPGGFGSRGIEGKVEAVGHARRTGKPFLGICLGMQVAVIEAARSLAGIGDATSTEFSEVGTPVVCRMDQWTAADGSTVVGSEELGGTMRLGTHVTRLREGSLAAAVYGEPTIRERHRHRYEVNGAHVAAIEATGGAFSGWSEDGRLPVVFELPGHPFFVGVQFHPEFKSRPFATRPLFDAFVEAASATRIR